MGELQAKGLCKSLGFVAVGDMGCRLSLITQPDQELDMTLRIATSFPALSKRLLCAAGFEVGCVQEFGGKVEGKLKNGFYNAIVDIVETGSTIEENEAEVRFDLLEPLQTGIVFRREPVNLAENTFPVNGLLGAIKAIANRKAQLDAGTDFDQSKKSTLSLMADQNKLFKALGEEQMEFGRALMLGEGEIGEAADIFYTVFTALAANGQSPLEVFNELARRNK